jgi:hypothetical protein
VRLWLRESERRPDPVPLPTDDRRAVLTGLVLWSAALAVTFAFAGPLSAVDESWWRWTIVVGLALGALGLASLSAGRARRR